MAPHGTNSRYTAGCHCARCKVAHAEVARADRRKRKKEARLVTIEVFDARTGRVLKTVRMRVDPRHEVQIRTTTTLTRAIEI